MEQSKLDATKKSVTDVFDNIAKSQSWESLYLGKPNRLTYNFISRHNEIEALLNEINIVSSNVLDLGCGTGELIRYFHGKVKTYKGIDISTEMIIRAQKIHEKLVIPGKYEFESADSENLDSKNTFQVVTAIALIEYFSDPTRILNEISRLTEKAGYALVTVPNKSCVNFKIRDMFAPIRNALYPIYLKLKKAEISDMRNVTHYHYTKDELDGLMLKNKFELVSFRFSNFYFIPHPLDHLFPNLYIRLSEIAATSKNPSKYNFFAANYIALYKKIN